MNKYKDKRFITTMFINAFCLAIPYALLDFEPFIFFLGILVLTEIDKLNYRQKIYDQKCEELSKVIRNRTK